MRRRLRMSSVFLVDVFCTSQAYRVLKQCEKRILTRVALGKLGGSKGGKMRASDSALKSEVPCHARRPSLGGKTEKDDGEEAKATT